MKKGSNNWQQIPIKWFAKTNNLYTVKDKKCSERNHCIDLKKNYLQLINLEKQKETFDRKIGRKAQVPY